MGWRAKRVCPSYSTVKYWVNKLIRGRETSDNISHDGRPVKVLTPEMIVLIEEEVLSDRLLCLNVWKYRSSCDPWTSSHENCKCMIGTETSFSGTGQERVLCASVFLDLCAENLKTVIEQLVMKLSSCIMIEKARVSGMAL